LKIPLYEPLKLNPNTNMLPHERPVLYERGNYTTGTLRWLSYTRHHSYHNLMRLDRLHT
jgi:hypothetical protein